jgi:hypothetical protein
MRLTRLLAAAALPLVALVPASPAVRVTIG